MKSSLVITFLSVWVFLCQGVVGDPSVWGDLFNSAVSWAGSYFSGSSGSGSSTTSSTTTAVAGTTTSAAAAATTTAATATADDEYCADPTTTSASTSTSTTGSTGSTGSDWVSTIWGVVSSWWTSSKKRDLDEFDQLSIAPEIMARANAGNTNKISISVAAMGVAALLV